MKKIFLLTMFILLFTVGCSNVKNDTIENIISQKIKENYNNIVVNSYHKGYKYYLPKKMSVKRINETNEIISSDKYTYYLYLDLVSVIEGKQIPYEEENNLYKDYRFKYKDLNGYLKIKRIENYY